MNVTLGLPDDLVIKAKKRAAELLCSLRDLVETGLRAELNRSAGARKRMAERVRIRWVTSPGGVPLGLDDRVAMHDFLTHSR